MDIPISSDRNVMQNETEKMKYKNLSTEIQGMWNMKCILPVVIGTTGIITKGTSTYVETPPAKHSRDFLQKKKGGGCIRGISHNEGSATI
jgi:hypothetical protein